MKYVRVIRLHICRVEKFTLLNNEVITWGYNPGVVGVIDAELSELWGYNPGVVGVTGL